MSVSVEIDSECCISSGKCVSRAPSGFAFDDEDLAVTTAAVSEIDVATLRRIANDCPGGAITVHLVSGS